MTHHNLTCAQVDALLGDYLDGALDDSAVAAIELHLAGCRACTAAAQDFEQIVRSAAALPALAPSRDLWPAIAQRIEAPVVALGASGAASAAGARSASWRRLRTAGLAAGLVGITALSTYLLTNRRNASTLADAAAVGVAAGDSAARRAASDASDSSDDGDPSTIPVLASAPAGQESLGAAPPSAIGAATRGATPVRRDPAAAARETFASEISTLRGIVAERRDDLDPRTIAILESSIATIDSAIADARRALEGDPASRFLSTKLDRALEKKLGLLRTAALLPART
jgi:hypothetical protein